jgi:hypothetical protein
MKALVALFVLTTTFATYAEENVPAMPAPPADAQPQVPSQTPAESSDALKSNCEIKDPEAISALERNYKLVLSTSRDRKQIDPGALFVALLTQSSLDRGDQVMRKYSVSGRIALEILENAEISSSLLQSSAIQQVVYPEEEMHTIQINPCFEKLLREIEPLLKLDMERFIKSSDFLEQYHLEMSRRHDN